MANVFVRRVLYGPRSLQQNRIQVTGFNPPRSRNDDDHRDRDHNDWCYPNTKIGDSWIFVLQPINFPEVFRLNSSLIKITSTNLDKFDSIIADKPYGFQPNFPELPCEKKYCPNNANCINDQYSPEGARCECITSCKSAKYDPVCGSDDQTYNNECELRMQSCLASKNIFVQNPNSCYYHRLTPGSTSSSTTYSFQSRMNPSQSSPYNQNYSISRQSPQPSNNIDRYTSNRSSSISISSSSNSNRQQYPSPPLSSSSSFITSSSYPGTNRWQTNRQISTTTINRSYSS
ncbi:Agrin-like protein 2 [Sarcoptes scabiei]|nr:Agrin-like protein 2 [Sarcoptes scabiei]